MAPDFFAFAGEGGASRGDDFLEGLEGWDVLVDDGLVDQRPQRFGRLHLRGVGGLEDEAQTVRHGEGRLAVPAGVVEREDDAPLAPGAGFLGEQPQQRLEERLGHPVRDIPEAFARGRRDERRDVEPFEAMMAVGDRPLADRRPDPAGHRLQADPVLVGREGFDRRVGMARRFLGDDLGDFFLNASCSVSVAAFGLRGRGF